MGQVQSGEPDPIEEKRFDPTAEPVEEDNFDDLHKGPFIQILYGSETNNGMRLAHKLAQKYAIKHSPLPVTVTAMDQFEPENLVKLQYLVIIVSTMQNGTPPKNGKAFTDWLLDATQDFRLPKGWLRKLRYTIVGLGSSDYKNNYNVVSKNIRTHMKTLGAKIFARPCILDYSDSIDTTPDDVYEQWALNTLLPALTVEYKKDQDAEANKEGIALQLKIRQAAMAKITGQDIEQDNTTITTTNDNNDNDSDDDDDDDEEMEEDMVDLEDMGTEMDQAPNPDGTPAKPRKMLTERQHKALTKQGYKIVGSHSGVKLCRWTKAMLRGRGGCYKHTFYGIVSYLCMEMTPSLACANKCTFCWRHHTNPVGKEWKWEMDQPEPIIDGAIENHRKMISIMRTTPGVQESRFKEAMMPKHCALSLVGEPIMYPEINKFLDILHSKDISSFLVTNAQFPREMVHLRPTTQLYLSIDAHSRQTLQDIDRPLNEDFWERFIESQKILATKKQRTVYRLTLVKGANMSDAIKGYSDLVAIGQPTFIEVKGVTFCGPDGGLTMSNVPYHEEVKAFCEELCKSLQIYNETNTDGIIIPEYDLACEHRHSCCILIADKRMKKDGQWHTWIDYPKFQSLYKNWQETGEDFTDEDYSCVTPSWAQYGAQEEGFSPYETRYRAKGKFRDNLKNKQTQPQPEGGAQCGDDDDIQTCGTGGGSCCQTISPDDNQGIGGCCKQNDHINPAAPTISTGSIGGCCQQQNDVDNKQQVSCCKTDNNTNTSCCQNDTVQSSSIPTEAENGRECGKDACCKE